MKNYWVCVMETENQALPSGFDQPPRTAAINAIENHDVEVKKCWSGWGYTESQIQKIITAICD